MASNMIGNLAVSLTMNTAAFQNGATLAEKRAAAMKTKMDGIGSSIAKIGGALALGAVAAGVAVLGGMAKSAFDLGSSLTEAAAKVGVTVEALQEMRFAATQNGISIETMDGSLNKMTKTLGELSLGNQTVAGNFRELGLSARDFIGLTPTESFAKIADALKGIENESVRAALGNKIFGRSYAELKPLVDLGADGINAAAEEKRKDGVISTEQARTLDDVADGYERLKEKVGVATAQLIANQFASQSASDGLSDLGSNLISLVSAYNSASNAIDGFLRKIDVYDAQASKKIAERLKQSTLTKNIPGVQAFADGMINRQDSRIVKLQSNGGVRGGTGRVPRKMAPAAPDVAAPEPYVPRVQTGGRGGRKSITAKLSEADIALKKFEDTSTALVERLFPEVKALVDYKANQNTLAKWADAGKISADKLSESLIRLRDSYYGVDGPVAVTQDGGMIENITDSLPELADVGKTTAEKLKAQNVMIVKSFGDTARDVTASITGLANSIKGGDAISILEGVANLFLNLGSAGVFGSKLQTNINRPAGRARGGATTSNRTYMVGERGPELFTSNRSGFITPNNKMGGGGRASSIQIIPSPYFNVVVDGRADGRVATAAPGIATAAAAGVQTNLQQSNFRTLP